MAGRQRSCMIFLSLALVAWGPQLAAKSILPPDPFPSTYTPLPRQDTAIINAIILDGAGGRIDNGAVLLKDGKVSALGADLEVPSGAVVIDAAGRWVTPGLIDMHSHIGNASLPITPNEVKVWDVNESSSANTAHVWAEHAVKTQDPAFQKALAGGVTTLQVLPGSINLFGGRGAILKNVPGVTVQDMKFPGAPVNVKMACGENPKYHHGGKGQEPTSRMGIIAAYRAAFEAARDYARKGKSTSRDFKLETLAGILNGEALAHVHCYRADDMANVLAVAKEYGFKISTFHHAPEAYKIAGMLAEHGACAAVWSDWWGFKMEAYDGIRENAAFVDAAGGCAIIHSDMPELAQRLTIDTAKAMAAGRRAGLNITPEHAISWITSNAADSIGLGDKIGALTAGKNADVVLWSSDPFSVYTKADMVFIDGAVAYDRQDPARQPVSDFMLGQTSAGDAP